MTQAEELAPVVIVEDRPEIQALLRALVERTGRQAFTASSTQEAEAFMGDPPGLLIVDIGLPGESGLEFIRRSRADPVLANVPIVVVTAHPDGAVKLRGEQGFDDIRVISKPFRFGEMAELLDGIFAER